MNKIIGIIVVLLIMLIGVTNNIFAVSTFNDIEDTTYEDAVINLVELDILDGMPNGNFGIKKKLRKLK